MSSGFTNSVLLTVYKVKYSNRTARGDPVGAMVGAGLSDGVALGLELIVGAGLGCKVLVGDAEGLALSLGSGENVGSELSGRDSLRNLALDLISPGPFQPRSMARW